MIIRMDEIAISKFKAPCLGVLEQVRRTRRPIRVTRFGKPDAEIIPPSALACDKTWTGSMADKGRIKGDIVSPAVEDGDWEVLKR